MGFVVCDLLDGCMTFLLFFPPIFFEGVLCLGCFMLDLSVGICCLLYCVVFFVLFFGGEGSCVWDLCVWGVVFVIRACDFLFMIFCVWYVLFVPFVWGGAVGFVLLEIVCFGCFCL